MEQKDSYMIKEIAKWGDEQSLFSLPSVQRGFVWKPFQIENLWDSLLRGYPLGAFVLSHKTGDGTFEVLDGQQRATAICLGFGMGTFRKSQDTIKVFIDLGNPRKDDNRKYIFRVITKSHPWGYSMIDNTKTLSAEKISKAMDLYQIEDDYLKSNLNEFFPFDASIPIPFHIFTSSASDNFDDAKLLQKIQEWDKWEIILKQWNEKIEKMKDDATAKIKHIELSNNDEITSRIKKIYADVKEILCKKIPALSLDFEKIKENMSFSVSEESDNIENDEDNGDAQNAADEIENLFVRLNAGGTPLQGEELNYSILKAKIKNKELIENIEEACRRLFKPARFITVAYRLFQHHNKKDQGEANSMRIKPKQFQKYLNEDKENTFEAFLNTITTDKCYPDNRTLLEYALFILKHDKDNPYGLPYLIVSKIADATPEIIFMLLYRIYICDDRFKEEELHRRAIGMISLFMWLGRGEKQRDHAKLLSNVWPCVKSLDVELFWSSSTVQRALLDEILTPVPSFKIINKINKIDIKRKDSDVFNKFKEKELKGYGLFFEKIFPNRDLLLYAQRVFLSTYFKEEQYHLEDTDMPFDWDHIFPQKLVHNQRGVPKPLKQFYNTIGNFRAWPYSLNRIDQGNLPAKKLNPLKMQPTEKELKDWQKFVANHKHIIESTDELSQKLIQWSFGCENWLKCEVDDIKDNWKDVYKLIMQRNLSVCKEWYDELCIEDLIAVNTEIMFSNYVDGRKWDNDQKKMKKIFKGFFDFDDVNVWVSKAIPINNGEVHFYFAFNNDPNPVSVLEEQGISFGILEKELSEFIKSIRIPDELQNKYVTDKESWIEGSFTLTSHDDDSYIELIKKFEEWMKKFPTSKSNVEGFKIIKETFSTLWSKKYYN